MMASSVQNKRSPGVTEPNLTFYNLLISIISSLFVLAVSEMPDRHHLCLVSLKVTDISNSLTRHKLRNFLVVVLSRLPVTERVGRLLRSQTQSKLKSQTNKVPDFSGGALF